MLDLFAPAVEQLRKVLQSHIYKPAHLPVEFQRAKIYGPDTEVEMLENLAADTRGVFQGPDAKVNQILASHFDPRFLAKFPQRPLGMGFGLGHVAPRQGVHAAHVGVPWPGAYLQHHPGPPLLIEVSGPYEDEPVPVVVAVDGSARLFPGAGPQRRRWPAIHRRPCSFP